jgi:LPXTG-motif cell wall-anchored protein
MKKSSLIKILLGIGAVTASAGSLAVVSASTPLVTEAASSENPSTPGKMIAMALRSTSWQTDCMNYNYAFRFRGTDTNSAVIYSWSKLAGWTIGQTDKYVLVALSPTTSGVSAWTSVEFYRFPSSVLDPLSYEGTDYRKTVSIDLTSTTSSSSSSGSTSFVGAMVIASGVAVPSTNTDFAAATSGTWSFSYPNRDYLACWAGEFMARTRKICTSEGRTAASFESVWSTCYQSYNALNSSAKDFFVKAKVATGLDYSPSAAVETAGGNDNAVTFRSFAAARYDDIVNHYKSDAAINNYAGRTLTSAAAVVAPVSSDSSSTLVLGGIAIAAALASGAYFFVRKKKSA